LSLVNWGFEEKRPVYVLSPSDPFIKQMVAYKYHLNPTGVLVEIGQQDNEVEPLEGATIQCEQMPNQREDIWLRGEKGELASIYLTNVELALNLKQKNLAQDFLLLAKDCGQGTADFRNKFASLETAIMDLNQ